MMKKLYTLLTFLCFAAFTLTAQTTTEVVGGASGAKGLALKGNDLYVAAVSAGKVYKIDITAPTPMLEEVVSLTSPNGLAFKEDDLYITTSSGISKVDLTAPTPTAVNVISATNLGYPLVIGDELYYCNQPSNQVEKINLLESTPSPTVVVSEVSYPGGLAQKGDQLYIVSLNSNSIFAINLNDTSPTLETIVSGLNAPLGLAINGSFLYTSVWGGLNQIDLNAENPTGVSVSGVSLGSPQDVLFNAGIMYITNGSSVYKIEGLTPSFTLPENVCADGATVSLGGASPTGGVYSGTGVTDDGNGETFTFDFAGQGAGTYTVTYTLNGASNTADFTIGSVPVFDLGPEVFPPTTSECYELNAMVTGGSGNYSYLWGEVGFTTPDLTVCPFATGFLDLTVTDNVSGCTAVDTFFYTFAAISLTGLENLCLDAGVQAGLSGGSPSGGVYSGPGVTDDGNGMTFSFDPFAAGAGMHTISYTLAGGGAPATSSVEVYAIPEITFTAETEITYEAGNAPAGQGTVSPAGGTFIGTGIVDDGNGMTFSFDAGTYAPGTYFVTYSYTDANGCANASSVLINVEEAIPVEGDMCMDANDIASLFGQEFDAPQTSGTYDNTGATTDDSDPVFGWDCFGEPDGLGGAPSLERTLWFSFTGDGNTYYITTVECDSEDFIDFGDTQMAIYSGDCEALTAEACNEDGPDAVQGFYPAGIEFETQPGVNYLMMIDGFGPDFPTDGQFCVEVTNKTPSSITDVQETPISVYPNPTSGTVLIDKVDAVWVDVFDKLGRLVAEFDQPSNQIDITKLPSGVYSLRIQAKDGEVYSARVIKE